MPKRFNSPVAMADIARLAGVSESTVSRALNNNPAINVDTRERIHRLAHKLNYKMNLGARNLRLRKTHTIAVVINAEVLTGTQFTDPFMMDLITSIADELNRHGYSLLFASTELNQKDWHTHLIASRRADGIIVIGGGISDSTLQTLRAAGDPLVVWGAGNSATDYCVVGSDNQQGGRLATEHLLSLGCKKIAFLGDTRHPEIHDRYRGYLDALNKTDDGACHNELLLKSYHFNSVQEQLLELLRQGPLPFDGLFASSDLMAMEAIKTLQQAGIRIPQAVRVVGFDDIPIAPLFTPALTTVRQDITQGGRALVTAILARLNNETCPPAVLPVELVVRES